jgi:hypothetical protein
LSVPVASGEIVISFAVDGRVGDSINVDANTVAYSGNPPPDDALTINTLGGSWVIGYGDAGNGITVRRTVTNTEGEDYVNSNTLTAPGLAAPTNTASPTIAYDGLSAVVTSPGEWAANPRITVDGYTYQWQMYDAGTWTDLPGQTAVSTAWTTGSTIDLRCMVTANNSYGGSNYSASQESNTLS